MSPADCVHSSCLHFSQFTLLSFLLIAFPLPGQAIASYVGYGSRSITKYPAVASKTSMMAPMTQAIHNAHPRRQADVQLPCDLGTHLNSAAKPPLASRSTADAHASLAFKAQTCRPLSDI